MFTDTSCAKCIAVTGRFLCAANQLLGVYQLPGLPSPRSPRLYQLPFLHHLGDCLVDGRGGCLGGDLNGGLGGGLDGDLDGNGVGDGGLGGDGLAGGVCGTGNLSGSLSDCQHMFWAELWKEVCAGIRRKSVR